MLYFLNVRIKILYINIFIYVYNRRMSFMYNCFTWSVCGHQIATNLGNNKNFWTEIKNINPTGKAISNSIGEANGAKAISKLFLEKYRSLYNSVPTDENELNSLRDVIDSNITEQIYITPDIIRICIGKLTAGKDVGDIGFKSDHIINGTHRLYVLLSLLYNLMFYHGHTPADLLKSTIVSIPKDNK